MRVCPFSTFFAAFGRQHSKDNSCAGEQDCARRFTAVIPGKSGRNRVTCPVLKGQGIVRGRQEFSEAKGMLGPY